MKHSTNTSPVIVVITFLIIMTSSCTKLTESTGVTSTNDLSASPTSTMESTDPVETSVLPTSSPTVLPEIVFDLTGDPSSTYTELLHIESGVSSLFIIGEQETPVRIDLLSEGYFPYDYDFNEECSLDGSSMALITDKNKYGSGRLFYTDGITVVNIASDVDTFHISADGTAVLYLVSPKYEHGIGGDLYHYDCLTGQSKMIAPGAGRLFTLSPDGDTVAYTTFYKKDYPDALTCNICRVGEDPTVLDKDSYCIAISNNAETIYYAKKEDDLESLFVRYNGMTKELFDGFAPSVRNWFDLEYYFYLNRDMTQIIFNADEAACFSMQGSDPVKVSDKIMYYSEWYNENTHNPVYQVCEFSDYGRTYLQTLNTGTENLCNFVFATASLEEPYDNIFEYVFNNEYLVFNENMNSTRLTFSDYMQRLCPHVMKIPACVLVEKTGDNTAFYLPGTGEFYNSSSNNYDLYVMHDDSSAEFVAASVSSIYLLEREGPDLLYYLARPDSYEEDIQRDYNLSSFFDLYSLEETPGAEPMLVAKQVCMVETGNFGIVYWQYKRSGAPGDDFFGGPFIIANVDVYYSKDGVSYTYVTERYYAQQYGC